jgi:hypothetical protein
MNIRHMNIRQNCIFSFEDALKMQPKSRLEKIIDTLDLQTVLTILNKLIRGRVDQHHTQPLQC